MWNSQLLFLSFSSIVLLGLLSVPGEAVDSGAVEYMKEELSLSVEKERQSFCGICNFFCPRLFARIRSSGTEGLDDGEDAFSRLLQSSGLIPMIEPSQKIAREGGSSLECEKVCTSIVKAPLNTKLDERQDNYRSIVRQGIETYPFTPGVFDRAVELLREEIEADERDLFTCKDNVQDRPTYPKVRANSIYTRSYFDTFYNWN